MAEAITYADLRFVKAPLKKSISTRLGQDSDDYEDGELTYENVQVPSAPEWPVGVAPPGLGNKAEVLPEQPPAAWSAVTSAAAGRVLPCCVAYTHLLLLGLFLTCLLLGVAAICLGVRYLQVSQQLQQTDRVLEATNSSLHQQLHLKITQGENREEELQVSRRELAQSQKALQVEQGLRQAAEGQLKGCQSDQEKTEETLRREEGQRSSLEQRLSNVQDTLKSFFKCSSPETCCPMGWIQKRTSCFYVSPIQRNWEDSRKHCKSLSSDLAIFKDLQVYPYYSGVLKAKVGGLRPQAPLLRACPRQLQTGSGWLGMVPSVAKETACLTVQLLDTKEILNQLLPHDGLFNSCWIGLRFNKNWEWTDGTLVSGFGTQKQSKFRTQNLSCVKVHNYWPKLQQEQCSHMLPCICEMAAFKYPDGEHFSRF